MFHPYRLLLSARVSVVLVLLTLVLVSGNLASPAYQTANDGVVTYREALIGDVQRLNPLFASMNPVDADITSLIFEGLTRINEYGEPVPALATGWTVSTDKLEYVVTLRDDVVWQDGIPFSADDVVYTMSLLRSPEFPGDSELGRFWRTIETYKLGPNMVRFRLTQPFAGFLDALRIGILPAHALAGTDATALASHSFNLSPIGTGPYQLEDLRIDATGQISAVDLRVAPNYRLRPEVEPSDFAIDRMSFVLFDSFDAVLAGLDNRQIDGFAGRDRFERTPLMERVVQGDYEVSSSIEPTIGFVLFNWANEDLPVFQEQRVRLALLTALNRQTLVDFYLFNMSVLADSPIVSTSWAYDHNLVYPEPNIESARQILESARLDFLNEQQETDETTEEATTDPVQSETVEPASNELFAFSILVPDLPELVNLANDIATQWSALNLAVTVESTNLDTYRSRLESGDFDVAIVELTTAGTADPDVYQFWHQGQYPDGQNYGAVNDRTISELLEKARRDPNGINRIDDYLAFQQEFLARGIAIPLYSPLYTYIYAPTFDNIQVGFIGETSDRFKSISDWQPATN